MESLPAVGLFPVSLIIFGADKVAALLKVILFEPTVRIKSLSLLAEE